MLQLYISIQILAYQLLVYLPGRILIIKFWNLQHEKLHFSSKTYLPYNGNYIIS